MNSALVSLARGAGITAVGAFLGALAVPDVMPTTLLGWKAVLLPAVGAALSAEIVFLRQQAAAAEVAAKPSTGGAT